MQTYPFYLLLLLYLFGASACEQLKDQRERNEPPALPPVYIDPEPFVSLTPLKMNVVYLGVDNPLDLRTNGVDLAELNIQASPPGYIKQYEKSYVLRAPEAGLQDVRVMHQGKLLQTFTFRAKPLPDPVALLGNKASGLISRSEFMAQLGLEVIHDNLDFNARCIVVGCKMDRLTKGADRETVQVKGARFGLHAVKLTKQAQPGDVFTFTNVKAKCPGDKVVRELNALVFDIY
ncbi:MAG: GldM family protein [Bacteroidota bacterium]